jgi:glycosyltransferase involved in cell wall biosynthesis
MSERALQILHVNMSLDPVTGGGTAERTMQLARALVELGHTSSILSLDFGLNPNSKATFSQSNVEIQLLPCILKRFFLPRLQLTKITRLVKKSDVIHLMGHWTVINILVFLLCILYKKIYVDCTAGALTIFGRYKLLKHIYNFSLGKKMVSRADACIAITEDEVAQIESYGVTRNNIKVIPNGINISDFSSRKTEKFRKKYKIKGPFILFMGRLNKIKGPDILLDAYLGLKDKHPDLELVFAGPDGGMLSLLRAKSSDPKIHYIGYIGGDDKSDAYHAADFLVIPSRQEAMSIVVLEAGAAGSPVLITDQCGFDEVEVIGGGKVVSASTPGIMNGIDAMLNEECLEKMGSALKQHVEKSYQWDKIASRYISLYSKILE